MISLKIMRNFFPPRWWTLIRSVISIVYARCGRQSHTTKASLGNWPYTDTILLGVGKKYCLYPVFYLFSWQINSFLGLRTWVLHQAEVVQGQLSAG